MKLVIIPGGGGRFGNQLISYANIVAWLTGMRRRYCLLFLPLYPYSAHFAKPGMWCLAVGGEEPVKELSRAQTLAGVARGCESLLGQRLWSAAIRRLLSERTIRVCTGLVGRDCVVYPSSDRCCEQVGGEVPVIRSFPSRELFEGTEASVTILEGWPRGELLGDWRRVDDELALVRRLTAIRRDRRLRAQAHFGQVADLHDVVVGVHVRRTDYATWCGGRYFFGIQQYSAWMRQVYSIYAKQGCSAAFLVASDDRVSLSDFPGLDVTLASGTAGQGGHFTQDLVELSLCDVVLAPPSTFSAWACIVGGTPLIVLRRSGMVIRKDMILHGKIEAFRGDPDLARALFI